MATAILSSLPEEQSSFIESLKNPMQTQHAGSLAAITGNKARHIRNRGFDNRYYRDLIVDLVR